MITSDMKKIFVYAAAVLAALSAVSCVGEKLNQDPELHLSDTEVVLSPEGTMQKIVYEIVNAASDASVAVSCDADWLEVSTRKARLIEISASKNESGKERTAEFTVSYREVEPVLVKVSQPAWIAPITLTVTGTESTSVMFSVTTAEDDFTWVGQVVGKDWFDEMESDEQIFQEDMSYYSYQANDRNISVSEYLATILNKGSYSGLQYGGLDPSSDYVIYVYGLTAEGVRTTDIYHAGFTTNEPYDGPLEFDIEISESSHVMDITITPSHDGVMYYWNIMDEATFKEWGEDVNEVVQSYIDYEVEDYLYYGDISSPGEYYEWYSSMGTENSQFECLGSTRYIVFAAKWGEDCKISGDVEYVWYDSDGVKPSDNKITLTLSNPSQSSFDVTTVTTNDDPYVVFSEPTSVCRWDTMDDQEIFDYIMTNYGTWFITDYICSGNLTEARFYDLRVDTEYTVVAFGYEAGVMTTAVQRASISTLSAGSPSDCEFSFNVNSVGATSANVTVTPSDDAYYYYWMLYRADATESDVKSDIERVIDELYWGDWEEFRYGELSRGTSSGTVDYLAPETEYKVAAVIIDENTGEYLTEVIFSDVFKTKAMTYANIQLAAKIGKYYDGDELAAAVEDTYDQYKGYAYLPVSLMIDGDYAEYYYTIFAYEDGMDDVSVYPDSYLYSSLVRYGVYYMTEVNFRADWDTPLLLAAVAIDHNGNYSRVFRKKFTVTRDEASPITDLIGQQVKSMEPSGTDVSRLSGPVLSRVHDRRSECKRMTFKLPSLSDDLERVKRESRMRKH